MRGKMKRFIKILCTVLLCLALVSVPFAAFADSEPDTDAETQTEQTAPSKEDIAEGEVVSPWIIAAVAEGFAVIILAVVLSVATVKIKKSEK